MHKSVFFTLAFTLLIPMKSWSFGSSSATRNLDSSGEVLSEKDDRGMPRCVYPEFGGGGHGLLLRWDAHEKYRREIEYARIEDIGLSMPGPMASADFLSCSDWERIQERTDLNWRKLPEQSHEIGGYELPRSTLKALAQVRVGATELHSELTAEEYLDHHPIEQYDRDLNRDLTHRFGVGFTSEIFGAWTRSRPENRQLVEDLHRHLENPQAQEALASQFSDRTIIIANGIGNDPRGGRLKIIFQDFESFGIRTDAFDTGPYETVGDNSDQILRQLEEALGRGQKVILLGASKSYPEILRAVSRVRDPSGIQAIIAISGLTDGSLLADWLTDNFLYPFWRGLASLVHLFIPHADALNLEVFRSVNTRKIRELYRDAAPRLPKHILYVNLIGVMGGDGLTTEPSIRPLQNKLIRGTFNDYGANDGYVEYPGNQIPESWGLHSYSLVVNGSHQLTDGGFEDLSLGQAPTRRRFFQALFETLDERMNSSTR